MTDESQPLTYPELVDRMRIVAEGLADAFARYDNDATVTSGTKVLMRQNALTAEQLAGDVSSAAYGLTCDAERTVTR